MKNKKILPFILSVTGLFVLAVEPSFAFLPAPAVLDPLYTEITSDVNLLSDKAWPIVFLVTGISIGIGLFKKFTAKAAS